MRTTVVGLLTSACCARAVSRIGPGEHKLCDAELIFHQMLAGRDVAAPSRARGAAQRQIFSFGKEMQNLIYLVGDAETRECIVIDGMYDPEGDRRRSCRRGMGPLRVCSGALPLRSHRLKASSTVKPPPHSCCYRAAWHALLPRRARSAGLHPSNRSAAGGEPDWRRRQRSPPSTTPRSSRLAACGCASCTRRATLPARSFSS